MANQNVFTNLINKGKVSRLKDWNYQVYDNRATLLADTYPATAQDGDASFTMALAVAENEVWFWNGAVANTDTTSAGNGTNWHSSDKDSEIVLGVTNPPIDSYNEATLVTAVAPTGLTANTKFVTWVDASGKEHLYSVTDPIGTPVFTEITTNKLMRVVNLTVTSEAEVLALVPLRLHTIYVNTTTGQEFLVDEDGGITTLKGKNRVGQVEWKPVTLVANTPYTFDLNNDAGIEIQDGEGAVAGTNEYALSANLLLNGINILDASNGLPLATNLYSVKPLTASTFTLESNGATDVIATFDGLLTKVEPVVVIGYNEFTFLPGTAPTIAQLETSLGITLENPVHLGDRIEFTNIGYTIPASAFSGDSNIKGVFSHAFEVGASAFSNCANLLSFIHNYATKIGNNCLENCNLIEDIRIPVATEIGTDNTNNDVFKDIVGQTIQTVEVNAIHQTSNAGGVEGDVAYLLANNTITGFAYV